MMGNGAVQCQACQQLLGVPLHISVFRCSVCGYINEVAKPSTAHLTNRPLAHDGTDSKAAPPLSTSYAPTGLDAFRQYAPNAEIASGCGRNG
jgi:hypothetical protein